MHAGNVSWKPGSGRSARGRCQEIACRPSRPLPREKVHVVTRRNRRSGHAACLVIEHCVMADDFHADDPPAMMKTLSTDVF